MEKKFVTIFVIFFLVLCFISSEGNAQTIVLKALSHLPKDNLVNDPVPIFVEKVNKLSKGRLRIDWVGGPEVIPSYDQVLALKKGSIDMLIYCAFSFTKTLMPEADAKGLSELTEWEERKSGAFKLWTEIFEKRLNAKYLGRFQSIVPFMIYSNRKITSLEDFKGLKIRSMPLYVPFLKALGAVPSMIPPSDMYTAVERKVVDAFMWPRIGMISWGLHEITKYVIEPGVFQLEPATFINLDKWKTIPKDLQDLIMDVMQDMEYIGTMRAMQIVSYEDNVRKKAGMEYIQLPPKVAADLIRIAQEETWKAVIAGAPEYGPKLKQLSSKSALPKGSFPWHK
ncbi:MAG TPA: TRAP transporter substrate-binding protein DctP [Syntrophorhabdaceae bacterium]|nr:TRAP transporter substrate-binding protein DctP [Syntrophorhabdaceae bacterium]